MKTAIKVTFAAKYTHGLDKLYTYLVKPEHDVQMNELVQVETADGLKNARVLVIDKQFSDEAEAKLVKLYGPLKYAQPRQVEPSKEQVALKDSSLDMWQYLQH